MKNIMRSMLMPALHKELQSLGLLQGGSMLLVGVSGGADSVALLHAMAGLCDAHDFSLTAVHVNHGLRGEASQGDAVFVQTLCRQLSVPLLHYTVDVRAAMASQSAGMEEAARILRYECFQKAMGKSGAKALLLAHHMDDQAETILMHLMRGSGQAGLTGMEVSQPFSGGLLVRPLLSFRRDVLCQALMEQGLSWREDATNSQPVTLRNRLRLDIMPLLEAMAPGCIAAMGRTAKLIADEEAWWQSEAKGYLRAYARFEKSLCFVNCDVLKKSHRAIARRMIRAFWDSAVCSMGMMMHRSMFSLDFDKTEELLDCALGLSGKAINLPGNVRGERSETRLFLIPPNPPSQPAEVAIQVSGDTVFGNSLITAVPWHRGMDMGDGIKCQAVCLSALEGAVVRFRRQGDMFPLFHGRGNQKFKQTLIDRHVDRPFRDQLPIIANGETVLWAPGVGPSGAASIGDDEMDVVLLSWKGLLPWEITMDEPSV